MLQVDPNSVGLQSAGELIQGQYGRDVLIMWAVGLLASGLVATICLTYAGQIIMVGLLELKVRRGEGRRGVWGQGVGCIG